jgi:hypothetical protein
VRIGAAASTGCRTATWPTRRRLRRARPTRPSRWPAPHRHRRTSRWSTTAGSRSSRNPIRRRRPLTLGQARDPVSPVA